MIFQPVQDIHEGRETLVNTFIDSECLIDRMDGFLQEVHDPFSEVIGVGDDFYEFLEPDFRGHPFRRDEWIKSKRRDSAANGVDQRFFARTGQQVAVISLPVKNQKGLFMVSEIFYEQKDGVGLAGS